jgi:hypothetical protein
MKKAILPTMFKRFSLLWSLLLILGSAVTARADDVSDAATTLTVVPAGDIDAEGLYYFGHIRYSDNMAMYYYYVNPSSTTGTLVGDPDRTSVAIWNYAWQFIPLTDDELSDVSNESYKGHVYYVYNPENKVYLGKIQGSSQNVYPTTDKASAGRYYICTASGDSQSTSDNVEFIDIDASNLGLHTNPQYQNYLFGWATHGGNSIFYIMKFDQPEGTRYVTANNGAFMSPYDQRGDYLLSDNVAKAVNASKEKNWLTVWTFIPKTIEVPSTDDSGTETTTTETVDNVYAMYNIASRHYIGKIASSGTGVVVPITDNIDEAGYYEFSVSDKHIKAAVAKSYDVENSDGANYLSFDPADTTDDLVNATLSDDCDFTEFYIDGDLSELPFSSIEVIAHHADLYFKPYSMKDGKGYMTAYPVLNKIISGTALNDWESVFTLEALDAPEYDPFNARDSYKVTDVATNLAKQYRIYCRTSRKYLAPITQAHEGNDIQFVDSRDGAGVFEFWGDNIDGTGIVMECVGEYSTADGLVDTDGDVYLGHDTSDGDLIAMQQGNDRIFYLTVAIDPSIQSVFDGAEVYISPFRNYNAYVGARPGSENIVNNYYKNELGKWKLIAAQNTDEENVYYFYNEYMGKYIESIGSNGAMYSLKWADTQETAGRYQVRQDPEYQQACLIEDIDATDTSACGYDYSRPAGATYLNINYSSTGGLTVLNAWWNHELNRLFYFQAVRPEDEPENANTIKAGLEFRIIPYASFQDAILGNNATTAYPDSQAGPDEHWEGYVNPETDSDGNTKLIPEVQPRQDTDDEGNVTTDYTIYVLYPAYDENGEVIPNVYLIMNKATGQYVPSLNASANNTQITLTDEANAGHYEILWDYWDQTTVYFHDVDVAKTDDSKAWWFWNWIGQDRSSIINTANVISDEYANRWNRFYIYPTYVPTDEESEEIGTTDEEKVEELRWVYVNTGDRVGDYKEDVFDQYNKKLEEILAKYDITPADLTKEVSTGVLSTIDYPEISEEDLVTLRDLYDTVMKLIADEENWVHPKYKHLYQIESPFPYFRDIYLKETYYEKDYHNRQDKQRLAFYDPTTTEDPVPSFWYFDKQVDNIDGYDSRCYYFLRAVNTEKVMRLTSNNTVVDVRDDSNVEAGLYSIIKGDICTYLHSVGLKSHYNSTGFPWNSGHSLLGLWSTNSNSEFPSTDHSVRDGLDTPIASTEDFVNESNIWWIWEVTDFPVYFEYLGAANYASTEGSKYYTTIYLPFDVKVPAGVQAYAGGYGLVTKRADKNADGSIHKYFDLVKLESRNSRDGSVHTDIIPANTPAILIADSQFASTDGGVNTPYRLEVIYWDTEDHDYGVESPMTAVWDDELLTLQGANPARGIEADTTEYLLHDDRDDKVKKVTGGADTNIDETDLHVESTNLPNMSLHGSSSTWIVEPNISTLSIAENPDDVEIRINDGITTGLDQIAIDFDNDNGYQQPGRDADGNLIYYDLLGRRVTNPTAGFYILTNGRKVILK